MSFQTDTNLRRNNPVWSDTTTTVAATVVSTGYFMFQMASMAPTPSGAAIISNTGPVNIYVGTSSTTNGILVQPGGALQIAADPKAFIAIRDATNTATFSMVLFSDAI